MKPALLVLSLLITTSGYAEIFNCDGTFQNNPCKNGNGEEINLPTISKVSSKAIPEGRARLATNKADDSVVKTKQQPVKDEDLTASLRNIERQIVRAKSEARGESRRLAFARQTRVENKLRALCAKVLNESGSQTSTDYRNCKELQVEARNIGR